MRKLVIIYFVLICGLAKAQHYPMYSQYLVNGLAINPAYAGRNEALDITLLHRRQWVGVEGAPVTTAFTMSSPLKNKAINLGVSIVDDRLGASSKQLINGIYTYRLKIKKVKLSFGVQGGLGINKTNWNQLKRNDQQDELLTNTSVTRTSLIVGAGIYLHTRNLFAGVSSPYLVNTINKYSFKESPVLINVGYLYSINKDHDIKPSVLVKQVINSPTQIDFNLNYYYKKLFGIGFSYRTKESIIGIAEIAINEQFKLSYSYDFGLSKIKKYNSGSHELMLRYLFGYSYHAKNPRSFAL